MSEREKLKKLAEYKVNPDSNLDEFQKTMHLSAAEVLALLSELEAAERELAEEEKAHRETINEFHTAANGRDRWMERSTASEAALRTLRQASQREVDMQQMSPAKYAEKYGLTLSLGVYVAEEKRVIAALAAALAAEGGK